MKRSILLLAIILCGLRLLSGGGTDIGKLRPVGLLQVSVENGLVVMETDTEDSGRGETVSAALKDLKRTAPGVIFLDTADYLLLTEEAMDFLPELREVLRPGTDVCRVLISVPTGDAVSFLGAHNPSVSLMRAARGEEMPPLLKWDEERFTLVK